MRLNKYVSDNTSLSRRSAEQAIINGRVYINGLKATITDTVNDNDVVHLDKKTITTKTKRFKIVILNKPIGYVCSKDGQGSETVYNLIPKEYSDFNIAGRLDKDSSGLVILTNNGNLLNELTHPRHQKSKIYEVVLNKPLSKLDWQFIHEQGVTLPDGNSKLFIELTEPIDNRHLVITLKEGRNRQIRRTFAALGYDVSKLNRTKLADYTLKGIISGCYKEIQLKQ